MVCTNSFISCLLIIPKNNASPKHESCIKLDPVNIITGEVQFSLGSLVSAVHNYTCMSRECEHQTDLVLPRGPPSCPFPAAWFSASQPCSLISSQSGVRVYAQSCGLNFDKSFIIMMYGGGGGGGGGGSRH